MTVYVGDELSGVVASYLTSAAAAVKRGRITDGSLKKSLSALEVEEKSEDGLSWALVVSYEDCGEATKLAEGQLTEQNRGAKLPL